MTPQSTVLMNLLKIVDELSAILRLPNETAVPLEADHQTMGRFLTISNPNYLIVRGCFDDILDARAGIFDSSCTFLRSSPISENKRRLKSRRSYESLLTQLVS